MTRCPTTVLTGALLTQAITVLAAKKISELPVVDEQGKPLGLIDITDVVGQTHELAPAPTAESAAPASWRGRPCDSRTFEQGDAVHEIGRPLS